MNIKSIGLLCASSLASLLPLCANAQAPVQEDFNSSTTAMQWTALNGACLTASTSYTSGTVPAGTIPGCVTSGGVANTYYTNINGGSTLVGSQTGAALPDTATAGTTPGTGALRLTNGSLTTGGNGNNETGAIISTQAFPSKNGLQITFNTVTYGGNAYNNGSTNSGADGMLFFLADASASASTTTSTTGTTTTTTTTYPTMAVGSYGGSLGYDCSSGKPSSPDGMVGAYIGLGIDEYGNFANKNDPNGNTNDPNAYSTKQPNAISIRGAGNINTAMVNALNASIPSAPTVTSTGPVSYTTVTGSGTRIHTTSVTTSTTTTTNYSVAPTTVVSLCATPTYTIVATPTTVTTTSTQVNSGAPTTSVQTTTGTTTNTTQTVMDYPFITMSPLIAGDNIYNQEALGSNPIRKNANKISYSLTLTSDGYLSASYSYNGGVFTPIIKHQNITGSGTTVNNGKIPDNFLYGFTAGTGGGSNIHEITCFRAASNSDAAGSAAGNVPQNAKIKSGDGTQIYLASYNPTYWTGSLTASGLSVDATTGTVTINPAANWDASCVLTGTANMPAGIGNPQTPAGSCPTTGGTVYSPQGFTNRAIATWDNVNLAGESFTYGALQTNQAAIMDKGPYTSPAIDNLGNLRVPFLRGDQTHELDLTFRSRKSILGDIINSSPVWVGLPDSPYAQTWQDILYPHASAQEAAVTAIPYATFQSTTTRLNVVYVGANDGMLHGFRAGEDSLVTTNNITTTVFNPTNNDGTEVLAYMPSLAFNTIHSVVDATATTNPLDYSDSTYAHNAFVDSTPGVGDLFYNGGWHTWLVGGLGAGGNGGGVVSSPTATAVGDIYALDITNQDPTTAPTDATVAAKVMGDWNTSTTNSNVSFAKYLGSTYGTPIIRRLHDGNWAAIFGNGLNSVNGTAGIFIMEITSTGTTPSAGAPAISFTYIDTGAGPSSDLTGLSTKNGIAYVASADLDGDHIVDYIYAGDVLGNVWRFDLTGATASVWASATPFELFTASTPAVGSTKAALQPITTAVTVNSILVNGSYRVMVDFGTGQQYPQSLDAAATYATGAQNLYGIWDWNMTAWNKFNSTQYTAIATSSAPTITSANLTQQKLTQQTISLGGSNTSNATQEYTATAWPICWPNATSCTVSGEPTTEPATSYGWQLPLPNTTEQIVYNPAVNSGLLFVSSTIPANNLDTTQCTIQNASGFSYAIDVATGGGLIGVFNTVTGQATTSNNAASAASNIVGLGLNAVGTPYFVTSSGTASSTITTMISQTQNGTPVADQVYVPPCTTCLNTGIPGVGGMRLTWLEIR